MVHDVEKTILPGELVKILQDPESIKAVGTLNADGSPYVVINYTLTTLDSKTLIFSEELEKSSSNKNMVQSIWFDKPVSVNVTQGGTSFNIQARPYLCLIAGKLFQEMLLRTRSVGGQDADISTVWILQPEKISNTSAGILRHELESAHPYFGQHLDRASIKNDLPSDVPKNNPKALD